MDEITLIFFVPAVMFILFFLARTFYYGFYKNLDRRIKCQQFCCPNRRSSELEETTEEEPSTVIRRTTLSYDDPLPRSPPPSYEDVWMEDTEAIVRNRVFVVPETTSTICCIQNNFLPSYESTFESTTNRDTSPPAYSSM